MTSHSWGYLTPSEVGFVDAAVSRLIPADELGPGAKEAGVTVFIDRQMCSSYGTFARAYRMGPWPEGTPQQGWQCPLTPREVYREAIREIDAFCVKNYKLPFCGLGQEEQDSILGDLQVGKFGLQMVDAKVFFDLLWKNTKEGFFSDPIHGGNRDKIGWKLVGFPGIASGEYRRYFAPEYDNKAYQVDPVSLLDIQEGRGELNSQGFPKHVKPQK